MLCYKGRTFCPFYEKCTDGSKCERALTPEIEEKAKALEIPIAQFDIKPECFEEDK